MPATASTLSHIAIGDKIRTIEGTTAIVSDLSQAPTAFGVPNRGASKKNYPLIWWPAACIISCEAAARRATVAYGLPAARVRFLPPSVPVILPPPRSRFPGPAPEPSPSLEELAQQEREIEAQVFEVDNLLQVQEA